MLIGYLGVKPTLPMRSRDVDVLRPVVELINFNLNVIKNCGLLAFSTKSIRGLCCGTSLTVVGPVVVCVYTQYSC